MKSLPLATLPLFLLFAAPALGAPCATLGGPPDVVIAPDSRSATIFPSSYDPDGFVVAGGASDSCEVSVAVPIPDGYYGVYKVDSRGFVKVEDGETATYSVTRDGDTQTTEVDGEFLDDVTYTHYFGTGLGPVAAFEAQFGLAVDGVPASSAELDSFDILAGYTTLGSQLASLDELSVGHTGIVSHLSATAGLLLNANQPVESEDYVSAFGAIGSHIAGATGHINLGGGLSFDAGAALFDQSVGGIASNGALLGGQVRYLQPEDGSTLRLLGSVGLNLAPGMSMSFTRHYSDGSAEGATATGTTTGTLFGIFVEGGALFAPTPTDEIVFSASISRSWLGVEGHAETIGETNLFPVAVDDSTGTFDTVKAKAAWTTALADDVDLTLTGAVGHVFANDAVEADVAFVGPLSVGGSSELFAEYGARLGWAYSDATTLSLFALGSTGSVTGTHVQAGGAVNMKF